MALTSKASLFFMASFSFFSLTYSAEPDLVVARRGRGYSLESVAAGGAVIDPRTTPLSPTDHEMEDIENGKDGRRSSALFRMSPFERPPAIDGLALVNATTELLRTASDYKIGHVQMLPDDYRPRLESTGVFWNLIGSVFDERAKTPEAFAERARGFVFGNLARVDKSLQEQCPYNAVFGRSQESAFPPTAHMLTLQQELDIARQEESQVRQKRKGEGENEYEERVQKWEEYRAKYGVRMRFVNRALQRTGHTFQLKTLEQLSFLARQVIYMLRAPGGMDMISLTSSDDAVAAAQPIIDRYTEIATSLAITGDTVMTVGTALALAKDPKIDLENDIENALQVLTKIQQCHIPSTPQAEARVKRISLGLLGRLPSSLTNIFGRKSTTPERPPSTVAEL